MDFRRLAFLSVGIGLLIILSCPKVVASKLIAGSWQQIEQLYFCPVCLLVKSDFPPYPVLASLENHLSVVVVLTFFPKRDICHCSKAIVRGLSDDQKMPGELRNGK